MARRIAGRFGLDLIRDVQLLGPTDRGGARTAAHALDGLLGTPAGRQIQARHIDRYVSNRPRPRRRSLQLPGPLARQRSGNVEPVGGPLVRGRDWASEDAKGPLFGP